MNAQQRAAESARRLVKRLALVACMAFFLGFGLVPLYEIACEKVFGIKLDGDPVAQEAAVAPGIDESRWVTVQFDATVNSKLGWEFHPKVRNIQVRPGQLVEAWYEATNPAATALVGNAVPSVAPSTASMYFNKTECFCFTEQLLGAGETRDMPVRFVVDPKLPPEVRTITLGYVFYLNDSATQRIATAGADAPPAS
ncbi:MAG: cytochrome c oxidase assembly protein [Xanthomonadaceae bacterium]|jgi:cytochrome c oxidase assembly protein subunit 11|nr:cytochrome c oxidase assembly protein [Xanthomonadaceae bacterium]